MTKTLAPPKEWYGTDAGVKDVVEMLGEQERLFEATVEKILGLPCLSLGSKEAGMLISIYRQLEWNENGFGTVRLSEISDAGKAEYNDANFLKLRPELTALGNLRLVGLLQYGEEAPQKYAGDGVLIKLNLLGKRVGFRLSERLDAKRFARKG